MPKKQNDAVFINITAQDIWDQLKVMKDQQQTILDIAKDVKASVTVLESLVKNNSSNIKRLWWVIGVLFTTIITVIFALAH